VLPDKSKIAMSSTDHDIAFYQQSYYEKRYKAVIINDILRKKYKNDMEGFYDESKKPLDFDFKNNDIEEELLPIYKSSKTWKEFF
jgi:folate-dependent tRNA-U54 methylase TrmFO/GidA